MKKRLNPSQSLMGREATENPSKQESEKKENVFAAHISTFFHAHPLLFGLIFGYIVKQLVINPLFFR